jgi:hypothetical protein
VAQTIRQALAAAQNGETITDPAGDGIEEAEEGRVITALHRRYERNSALVKAKKKKALATLGSLACEACGFDFREHYGDHGEGFIECHHTKPVHTLKPGDKTKARGPSSAVFQLSSHGPCEAALVDYGAAGDSPAADGIGPVSDTLDSGIARGQRPRLA